jgi:hypothetical protein
MIDEKSQVLSRGRPSEDFARGPRMRRLRCAYLALTVPLISLSSLAQTAPATSPREPSTQETAPKKETADTQKPRPVGAAKKLKASSDAERLDRLEQFAETTRKENEALKKQLTTQDERITQLAAENESLASRQDDAELAEMASAQKNELKIYGFADVQWYKFIFDDKCWYNGFWNDKNSFTVGHWNIYLEKSLNDHFRFLGEVRFLFQPYGEEISFQKVTAAGEEIQYKRVNTKAVDWVDGYGFNWGGIAIQRLWIEYKLNDYFSVRAGNYLTPWGVWNVDHASSVVIPGHRPYIITAQMLPETQTGLILFGRIFPTDTISLDYALTLSNGRGPTTKIYDLDENKAMGLKLSFQYDGAVSLGFGTHLYIGEYTDIVRIETMVDRYEYETDFTENYIEKAIAFHLKFQWKGLVLQGEYARGLIKYTEDGRYLFFEEGSWGPTTYLADYIQQGAYALLAYRLPVDAINLSPFFIYEFQQPKDYSTLPRGHNFGGGINWRIIPELVWKIDYVYHRATDERWNIPASLLHFSVISTQLAVNF